MLKLLTIDQKTPCPVGMMSWNDAVMEAGELSLLVNGQRVNAHLPDNLITL
jgi:hypothetical protein